MISSFVFNSFSSLTVQSVPEQAKPHKSSKEKNNSFFTSKKLMGLAVGLLALAGAGLAAYNSRTSINVPLPKDPLMPSFKDPLPADCSSIDDITSLSGNGTHANVTQTLFDRNVTDSRLNQTVFDKNITDPSMVSLNRTIVNDSGVNSSNLDLPELGFCELNITEITPSKPSAPVSISSSMLQDANLLMGSIERDLRAGDAYRRPKVEKGVCLMHEPLAQDSTEEANYKIRPIAKDHKIRPIERTFREKKGHQIGPIERTFREKKTSEWKGIGSSSWTNICDITIDKRINFLVEDTKVRDLYIRMDREAGEEGERHLHELGYPAMLEEASDLGWRPNGVRSFGFKDWPLRKAKLDALNARGSSDPAVQAEAKSLGFVLIDDKFHSGGVDKSKYSQWIAKQELGMKIARDACEARRANKQIAREVTSGCSNLIVKGYDLVRTAKEGISSWKGFSSISTEGFDCDYYIEKAGYNAMKVVQGAKKTNALVNSIMKPRPVGS